MVRYRSALEALTLVATVAELLLATRSLSALVTVAVLTIGPAEFGLATIVMLALVVTFPMLQVTVPPANEQLPTLVLAEMKVRPAGSVSVTTTPVAGEAGPLLKTVIE